MENVNVPATMHLKKLAKSFDLEEFRSLNEELTFGEYLDKVYKNPKLIRSAYQRLYDMVLSKGTKQKKVFRRTITEYNFFQDSEIPVFGLEEPLDRLMKLVKGAAGWYGTEKRVFLLHGPVGSSKSTICRLIKRGLEKYSRTPDGALYTFKWVNLDKDIYIRPEDICAMRQDPLTLIPIPQRKKVLEELNVIHRNGTPDKDQEKLYGLKVEGDLNPRCKRFMADLMKKYNGDWEKVVTEHVRVVRMVYSEADRIGIATFQPKDEKNQDATELTGDIDYSKLPHFGSDSDPRAFNFDGEFCAANRGFMEFIEVLKLEKAFLYDLLGASQERQIKPKKFSQISIDEVIIGHTNNPEYEKLKNDKTMEALRDRTVKIDIPYLLKWSDELKVLEQDYGVGRVRQHVAPHTLEIAALWAILTRLVDDKEVKLSLVEKAKLYDGRSLPGYTEDSVKEMHDKHPDEGMYQGVSARYVQDKISACLSSHYDYINPFMVMNEIKAGLDNSSLITNKDEIAAYNTCVELAMKELDQILKQEVQRALVGDEDAIIRLCDKYVDNLMAFINKTKIINQVTQREQEPDERLMRAIEEKIDIPEQMAEDFRRSIAVFMSTLLRGGKQFKWDSNPQLKKALEQKLFEDTKDHIKLSALNQSGASVVDPDMQEKIDAIKHRLIKQYGYNDKSATDVLDYVGSIFARGDSAEE
jgi:serine protein kinase